MNALEVDVTALIIAVLKNAGFVNVDSVTPDNLQTVLPFVRVVRQGGPNDGIRLDAATVVLHGFGASPSASRAVLLSAATAIRKAVGTVINGNATISNLRVLAGPNEVSYSNPLVAHAFSTLQVHVKDT